MSTFIEVRFSDDGGNNWSNWRELNAGTTGSFLKPLIRRLLGWTREERIWEFRDTSNVAAEVLSASIMALGNSQWRPLPLPDGSYSDDTRPWTSQDVCDFLPTFAEANGTRSLAKYMPVPGLVTLAGVGNGPHRGSRDVEGKLFVVSGNTLYQVATDGTATSRGTIPGTRRVSMVHNQIDGGNELIIATGDNSYVWNTVTETLTATGVPLLFVDFLNQLIIGIDVARRFWRWSGLADATSWNSLDNESAESSPDRLVGQIVSQGEVLLFGERTIEVWSNSPSGNLTFQRSTVIEKGCANGNTICRLDNTVYFVGNDSIAYRLQGYTPVPISSKAITDTISDGDPSKLFAFTWEDKGYVVYYLTAQDGNTWGFDVTCQKWHRRESFGLTRWRVNTLCKWNGDWYAGDYSNGKLYRLTWGNVYEGCEIMPRTLRTGVMHNNGNRMFISALKLLVNTGREPSAAPSDTPPTISGGLPDGMVGDVVSYQLTVTPAYPGQAVTISATGLPDGLGVDSSGLITGTMAAPGAFTPTYTGTTDCGAEATLVDSVTVADFTISGDVPDGRLFATITGTYTNNGGIEPITYAVTAGTFPAGLTLDADGSYSGEYSTSGTYSWTVTGTDSNGNIATLDDTATVGVGEYWNVNDRTNQPLYYANITNNTRDFETHNDDPSFTRYIECRGVHSHATGSVAELRYFEIEVVSRGTVSTNIAVRTGLMNTATALIGPPASYTGSEGYYTASGAAPQEDEFSSIAHNTCPQLVPIGGRVGILVNTLNGAWWPTVDGVSPTSGANTINPASYPNGFPGGVNGGYLTGMSVAPMARVYAQALTGSTSIVKLRLHQYADELLYLPVGASAWVDG